MLKHLKKNLIAIIILTAALLLALPLSGVMGQAEGQWVFLHAMEAPDVDVYLDGTLVKAGVPFVTQDLLMQQPAWTVPAGTHTVEVRVSGEAASSQPLASLSIDIVAGELTTVVASGGVGGPVLYARQDNLNPLEIGTARVSALNAAAGQATVSVALADGTLMAPNLDYAKEGVAPFGTLDVPVNAYALQVMDASGTQLADVGQVPFYSNTFQIMVVIAEGGTGPGVDMVVVRVPVKPAQPPAGYLRFVNAASGPLDIYADGTLIVPGLDFAMNTNYIPLPAATYNVETRAAGTGPEGSVVASIPATLAGGAYQTLALWGDAAAPTAQLVEDNTEPTSDRSARVRAVNALSGDSAIDVLIPGGSSLVLNLGSGQVSPAEETIIGDYDLNAVDNADQNRVIAQITGFQMEQDKTYTLYLIDSAPGTGETGQFLPLVTRAGMAMAAAAPEPTSVSMTFATNTPAPEGGEGGGADDGGQPAAAETDEPVQATPTPTLRQPTTAPIQDVPPVATVITEGSNLLVREGPASTYTYFDMLAPGFQATVLGRYGEFPNAWVQIEYQDSEGVTTTGWVFGNWVRITVGGREIGINKVVLSDDLPEDMSGTVSALPTVINDEGQAVTATPEQKAANPIYPGLQPDEAAAKGGVMASASPLNYSGDRRKATTTITITNQSLAPGFATGYYYPGANADGSRQAVTLIGANSTASPIPYPELGNAILIEARIHTNDGVYFPAALGCILTDDPQWFDCGGAYKVIPASDVLVGQSVSIPLNIYLVPPDFDGTPPQNRTVTKIDLYIYGHDGTPLGLQASIPVN